MTNNSFTCQLLYLRKTDIIHNSKSIIMITDIIHNSKSIIMITDKSKV